VRRIFGTVLAGVFVLGVIPATSAPAATKVYNFTAEIWADNWFALYVNGKKVGEDSTPFATERSFNSDAITFKASYPLTIGIMARDYVENASGLEYIGKPNQQIGDGGIIAQIRDTDSKQVITATNKSWKVFVTNKAPLNEDCVKSKDPLLDCKSTVTRAPTSWYSATFKDTSWKSATEFTAAAVGVKDGYSNFTWWPTSSLVWSSDLRIDNTILLRTKVLAASKVTSQASTTFTVGSPDFSNGGLLPKANTCDGTGISPALTFSGVPINAQSLAVIMDTIPGPLRPGEVDIGNHFYLILYDIPANTISIPAGATNIGTLGQNFQGKKLGYTPPCSQGSGLKEYTITAFALSEKLNLNPSQATESAILKAVEGKTIAKSLLVAKYQRP
jgi:phosphatidylethanolamine-binding protein (PEBP) family uncharacterized protein